MTTISELTTLPVRAGAALRDKRFFHPTGVLCGGTVTRTAPAGEGLPLESGDVVGVALGGGQACALHLEGPPDVEDFAQFGAIEGRFLQDPHGVVTNPAFCIDHAS